MHANSRGGLAVVLGLSALFFAACGGADKADSTITRKQWRQVPWDSTQARVVHRLGVSPSSETKEKCSPAAGGRFCTKTIVYEFGDVKAQFVFLRPARRGAGRLSSKTWFVSSGPNRINARQYRRAIRRGATASQVERRLGPAEQRHDYLSVCEVPGHRDCGTVPLKPTRCLTYGWSGAGGNHVSACFDLNTGKVNAAFLKPQPSLVIRVPVS